MSERQTTICAGDIVQDRDGVQWQVRRVLRSITGWMVSLDLERTDSAGELEITSVRSSAVRLVGRQLQLGGGEGR